MRHTGFAPGVSTALQIVFLGICKKVKKVGNIINELRYNKVKKPQKHNTHERKEIL